MFRKIVLALALLAAGLAGGCVESERASAPGIAIVGVNLIDGTGAPLQRNRTVLIEDDRIVEIGDADVVAAPSRYKVIDASGRYLIPGLWDSHVHLSKTRASAMALMLAHGVTSVRDMGGDHEELLRWRSEIQAGERVGPRIFLVGPFLESKTNVMRQRQDPPGERVEPVERTRMPVGSPEEAQRIVSCLAATDIDFIKVREFENLETLLAIGAAAGAHELELVGHAFGLSPDLILKVGYRSVEHAVFPTLEELSRDERLAEWRKFQENGVHFTPTLISVHASVFTDDETLAATMDGRAPGGDSPINAISQYLYLDWKEQALERSPQRAEMLTQLFAGVVRNWAEMREVGVTFLAGTDAGVLMVFPGQSLHEELALLTSEVGMTPMEALQSATRAPAAFVGRGDELGVIEAGKLADLVLLDADPLADIANTTKIAGVMQGGVYYDKAALAQLREQASRMPDIQTNDWPRRPDENDRHQCMEY